MKEWIIWIEGWILYPLVVIGDTKSAPSDYHTARLALRDWLTSRPSREKRLRAHELTGRVR